MARQLRIETAGLWYRVTARGNERKDIIGRPRIGNIFLELFPVWVERFGFCRIP